MKKNPEEIVKKGHLIIPASVSTKECVQQNGIDITCDRIFKFMDPSFIISKNGSKEGTLTQEFFKSSRKLNNQIIRGWNLKAGNAYTMDSNFYVSVPEKTGASVIGRSTFNRNGILIRSSWYDSGFKGNIGATIYCMRDCFIEEGTRVAQIIFEECDSKEMYDGQYQGK
jgi:deoxycytidine triphosphate deaminase